MSLCLLALLGLLPVVLVIGAIVPLPSLRPVRVRAHRPAPRRDGRAD